MWSVFLSLIIFHLVSSSSTQWAKYRQQLLKGKCTSGGCYFGQPDWKNPDWKALYKRWNATNFGNDCVVDLKKILTINEATWMCSVTYVNQWLAQREIHDGSRSINIYIQIAKSSKKRKVLKSGMPAKNHQDTFYTADCTHSANRNLQTNISWFINEEEIGTGQTIVFPFEEFVNKSLKCMLEIKDYEFANSFFTNTFLIEGPEKYNDHQTDESKKTTVRSLTVICLFVSFIVIAGYLGYNAVKKKFSKSEDVMDCIG